MIKIYLNNLVRTKLQLSWRACLALILFISIGTSTISAQVSGYIFSQSTGAYTSANNPTILATATGNAIGVPSLDTSEFPITLPFSFIFNGQPYTDVRMSTNGYIAFGTGSATGSTPISSTTAYDGVISAFGRDLNTVFDIAGKTGNMSWAVEGTAPNRVAVIQWENFRPTYSSSATAAYVFSFQIRLTETTNVISTVYSAGGYLIGTTAVSSTAQIGLRGSTNTDFNNRLNPTTVLFNNSAVGTANNSSQAFNSAVNPPGMPDDGLTYTWTPPTCLGPNTLAVSNITTTSANLTWNASPSAPANGYDIYYSTSNVAPTSTSIPNIAGVTGLTQSLSSLTPASQYYVWVRAVCSTTDASNWVGLPNFNTACAPINDMFENFDGYSTGSIVPNCWDRIISGSGTQTISSTSANSTPNNLYQFSGTAANQTIVVLPVFGNINAGTHWLRLKARVTTAPRTIEFGYVTNATDATSFVLIEAKSIINTTYASSDSEYTFVVPTTVPSNARLAIKNPGTLSTTLYYDDVYWEAAPTCLPPTNVVATGTSPTTATVTWTASTTPPTNGYEVYYSTNNTPPTAATVANVTGVVGTTTIISGLTPSTVYYVWVKSKCSAIDSSTWTLRAVFNTPCQPPAVLTTNVNPTPVCVGGTATISGTTEPGATLNFYDAATAGNLLGTGNSYTSPILTNTTNYWVSASVGGSANVGKVSLESNATTGGGLTSYMTFDAVSDFTLQTVDLFPYSSTAGTAGTVTITLLSDTGVLITSATVNVIGQSSVALSTVPQTVTLNFPVVGGQSYRLGVSSWTGITNMYRDATNLAFPYSLPGVVDITGGSLSTPYYYFFYNWSVSTKCESPRTMVTAVYDSTCNLGTTDVEDSRDVKIYPNPFTDVLNISEVKNLISVSITDLSGRTVKTIAKPTAQIYLGELQSGMYLVNMKYKDGSVKTVKAIKK